MKEKLINEIENAMSGVLTFEQTAQLSTSLLQILSKYDVVVDGETVHEDFASNARLLEIFLSAKQVEGCSIKTIRYYESTIRHLFNGMPKNVADYTTEDIRAYLAVFQSKRKSSKVTIDNIRRIFSSFFAWLEEEDYILKSPVRRIHKVKTGTQVKEVLSDEALEMLRDNCKHIRDLAILDLLSSTGMRVGELVKLNRNDVNFQERECIVFGKGSKERMVYFNARTKIHLQQYLKSRKDKNPALFVSLAKPHDRLQISGVEMRLRNIGRKLKINRVHPHKFRRTLATMAIDKGMPVEQVQRLLGHVKIDTTMHYAMVNQTNVKLSHRKFIN
ncbi:site-specific tyrosine recombinase/integron integrase [Dysgonomonas macrotermitis]|uniref:Site-specific recombinase XerD n=1 Tax=Dysgonomonas macrotermitis TaxID=1346286 RepID=A0A1M4X896_9BACT|nr:site-specific tyrosine recombinase/integron integrase [Dysgonomonas macrotermitis]SHE89694.1 Site-specific recombinase XerD [Dysgonomonas macrotermitis]